MSDINLAFAGGDKCREHADALHERRRQIADVLYPESAAARDEPEARKARTLEQVKAAAAMFGRSL